MSRLVCMLKQRKLEYSKGLALQKYIATKFNPSPDEPEEFRNVLIITEHDPVYTIGIRTKDYTIDDENRLRKLGAQFYRTDRGGLITFHGPGQMVAYPVLNLKQFTPSMRWYVQQLEKTIIDVCKEFKVTARTTCDTGVWVDDRKICSIGVHGSRYITTHGLALNCNTDLTWFDHIVPCGLEKKSMTSLSKELQTDVGIDEVLPVFKSCFEKCFNCRVVDLNECDKDEALRRLEAN